MRVRGICIKGLTLAEIMISIMLLALMLVTTLVLFSQLLASTTKNGYLDTASLYADTLLEQAAGSPSKTSPAFAQVTNGQDEFMVDGEATPTTFVYRMDANRIGETSSGGERWLLEMEVRWWSEDPNSEDAGRPGYGQLRAKQERLVYVKW